ncbi:MAG: Glu/Leu/Phe/Val dehydrogenase [Bacteroidota bacterium]|nr:Glu/Leu/Phe/Val dehydrogenase [Bacteroidota bacterium]
MSVINQESVETKLNLFEGLKTYDHEQIVFCQDNATGLKAIIAIHNTVLGPGLGGTRMWAYNNEQDAINDVMRLSRGMTYKAALAGLNLGGAKAVIIGDAKIHKTEALMRKFGRFVENLSGKYITAEDVGTTTLDMEHVRMETKHVVGLPKNMGGGGDPSPVTAYGVYMGMKASAKHAWGNDGLSGKTIAIQGIGKVGGHLIEYLTKEGAKIYVADINSEAVDHYVNKFGCIGVPTQDIIGLDVDVFAPCALGAVLNTENIEKLKCSVVCGAANNQLADEKVHGPMLVQKGIAYAPDYLVNAGGLINVYQEHNGYVEERAMSATQKIYDICLAIHKKAADEGIHTQLAANSLAEKRVNDMMKVHSTY